MRQHGSVVHRSCASAVKPQIPRTLYSQLPKIEVTNQVAASRSIQCLSRRRIILHTGMIHEPRNEIRNTRSNMVRSSSDISMRRLAVREAPSSESSGDLVYERVGSLIGTHEMMHTDFE
jgi:hypothetical protein